MYVFDIFRKHIVVMIAGVALISIGVLNIIIGHAFHAHLVKQSMVSDEQTAKKWKRFAGKDAVEPYPLEAQQFFEFLGQSDPRLPKMTKVEFDEFKDEFNLKTDGQITLPEFLAYRQDARKVDVKSALLGMEDDEETKKRK